jgi:microcystin-dependent protein
VSNPYVGEIRMVGFNFAPVGWAFCDGSLMAISVNETLFNLIGTTYGGDGQSTFALPDLRGRIPIHQGNSFVLSQQAGTETVTLTGSDIPSHSHSLTASSAPGTQPSPANGVWAASALNQFSTDAPATTMAASLGNAGGDQPHDNMPTFQVINYVISLFGIFPSQ